MGAFNYQSVISHIGRGDKARQPKNNNPKIRWPRRLLQDTVTITMAPKEFASRAAS